VKKVGVARHRIDNDSTGECVLVRSRDDAGRIGLKPLREIGLGVDRAIGGDVAEADIEAGVVFVHALHATFLFGVVIERVGYSDENKLDAGKVLELLRGLLQTRQGLVFDACGTAGVLVELDGAKLLDAGSKR